MKPDLIITHPGNAHRDEVLAVALALVVNPNAYVARRDPTVKEMTDPATWVIDVGMKHEPELGNFDHHQFNEGVYCAASLILLELGNHLGKPNLYRDASEFCTWMRLSEILDNRGPSALAEHVGTTPEVVVDLMSPIEEFFLSAFGKIEVLSPRTWLHDGLVALGLHLVEKILGIVDQMKYLDGCRLIRVKNLDVVVLPDTLRKGQMNGLREWCKVNAPCAVGCIGQDERNPPGHRLIRFNDHPQVDFRKVKGKDGVTFVHANGFIAVVAGKDVNYCIDLFTNAVSDK